MPLSLNYLSRYCEKSRMTKEEKEEEEWRGERRKRSVSLSLLEEEEEELILPRLVTSSMHVRSILSEPAHAFRGE